MKIAVVIQRYGDTLVGGAESHARSLVDHLVSDLGYYVEVWTTTAKCSQTWKNSFQAGCEANSKVTVRRFNSYIKSRVLFGVYKRFVFPWAKFFLKSLSEAVWIRLQGPWSPSFVEYIKYNHQDFNALIFFTYLYYPCQVGINLAGQKVILVPTAHDEEAFWFDSTKKLIESARLVMANSEAEKRLLESLNISRPISLLGAGIEAFEVNPQDKLDYEYFFYLGRVGKSKNTPLLIEAFRLFKQQRPSTNLKLVLAGQLEAGYHLPELEDIVFVGQIGEDRKWQLIKHATAVINPSNLESLSLVALEGFLARRPVILNKSCEVFLDYCSWFPSALGFSSKQELVEAMFSTLMVSNKLDFSAAADWVESNYSWKVIIQKLDQAVKLIQGEA